MSDIDPEELLQERPDRLLLTSFAELVERPPAPWLIRGIIRETSAALIYGQRGSYKSFVVLDMATCLAAGVPWQGQETVSSGLVVYVAAEGGGGLVQRARAVAAHYDIPPTQIQMKFVTEPVAMTRDSEDVEILIHRIKDAIGWQEAGLDVETGHYFESPGAREWPVLIIIDTLAQCFVGEENSSEDMGMFIQVVNRLKAEFACSILIVHHSGRDATHERGHTNLPGACDTIFKLEPEDNGTPQAGLLTMTCEKMKDGPEPPAFELSYKQVSVTKRSCDDPKEELTSVVIGLPVDEQEARRATMLEVLLTEGPLSWLDWQTICEDVHGISRGAFQRAYAELRDTRKIAKIQGIWQISEI